ncbi:hypothetical protein LTS08_002733 [Lithohypha guttulata]|nr:hypothetical protein LTS08_002733 [Lithohypha guttulata]
MTVSTRKAAAKIDAEARQSFEPVIGIPFTSNSRPYIAFGHGHHGQPRTPRTLEGPKRDSNTSQFPVYREDELVETWWKRPLEKIMRSVPKNVKLTDFMLYCFAKMFEAKHLYDYFPADFDQTGMVRVKRERIGKAPVVLWENKLYYPVYKNYYILHGDEPCNDKLSSTKRANRSDKGPPFSFGSVRVPRSNTGPWPLQIERQTATQEVWNEADEERSTPAPQEGVDPRWRLIEIEKTLRDDLKTDLLVQNNATTSTPKSIAKGRKRATTKKDTGVQSSVEHDESDNSFAEEETPSKAPRTRRQQSAPEAAKKTVKKISRKATTASQKEARQDQITEPREISVGKRPLSVAIADQPHPPYSSQDSQAVLRRLVLEQMANQPILLALNDVMLYTSELDRIGEDDASDRLNQIRLETWRKVIRENLIIPGSDLGDFIAVHGLEEPETVLEGTIATGVELLREEIDRDGDTASWNTFEEVTTTVNLEVNGSETRTVGLVKREND